MRPKLKPHQLRPCDPEEDLDPKYRDSYNAMEQMKNGINNPGFTPEADKIQNSKF